MIYLSVIPDSEELANHFPGVLVVYAFDQSNQVATQLEPGREFWMKSALKSDLYP